MLLPWARCEPEITPCGTGQGRPPNPVTLSTSSSIQQDITHLKREDSIVLIEIITGSKVRLHQPSPDWLVTGWVKSRSFLLFNREKVRQYFPKVLLESTTTANVPMSLNSVFSPGAHSRSRQLLEGSSHNE